MDEEKANSNSSFRDRGSSEHPRETPSFLAGGSAAGNPLPFGANEESARAALEDRIGPLDEQAWKRHRDRLIQFVLILRRWDDQRKILAKDTRCTEQSKPAA